MLINLRYHRFRRVTLFSVGCGAFLVGLGLVKAGVLIIGLWWLFVAGFALIFCLRRKWPAILGIAVLGLVVGLYRGGQMELDLQKYQPLYDQKVSVHGVIIDDPTYGDRGEQVFRISQVRLGEGNAQALPGQMRITTHSIAGVERGDEVEVSGKLRSGFGNYQAAIYFAEIQNHVPHQSLVDQARHLFAAGTYNALPEPNASLSLGFLVGLRSQLPEDLDTQMRIVGLTHIVVASGYNLTILVRLGRRLFAQRSKYQATVVSVGLMAGFVLVTGFSPSMSRAALVTGLALAAWYFGRRVHPVFLLLLAASITAGLNPLYIWSDIGWYLSFLAFGGVMLLAPLVQTRIYKNKKAPFLGQIAIETICAQLLTLPLILFIFGDFSTVALLANLLVVPVIPVAMLLGFAAGLAGIIAPTLAGWVALPANWILSYVTEVISLLARIPWAQIPLSINTFGLVCLYVAILFTGFVLYRKTRHNYLATSVIE